MRRRFWGLSGLLLAVACSSSPRSQDRVTVADKLTPAAAATGTATYLALFPDRASAEAHASEARRQGAQVSLVGDEARLLRVEAREEQLAHLTVARDAMVVRNGAVRIHATPSAGEQAAGPRAADAESFLTVRQVTGVEALLKRFPEADGRGVKVAVFDTGIDFGVEGVSRDGKLLGFYDFTDFGVVKGEASEAAATRDTYMVDGMALRLGEDVQVKDVTATGVLDEKALAAAYLTAQVDVDGNEANRRLPFLIGHNTAGQAVVWIDINGDGVLRQSDHEELHDFNSTGSYVDMVRQGSGARPLAVSIRSATEVQFHSVPEGHGTSCAIIIAGNGYADGKLRGMAPEAKLLAYVLDMSGQDVYTLEQFLKMFLHAKSQGVDAISISWGFSTADLASARFVADFLDKEIAAAGIVIGIAAGNEGAAYVSAAADDYIPRFGFGVGAQLSEVQARHVYGWTGTAQDAVIWYSSFGPTRGGRAMPDVVSPLASFVRGSRTTTTPVFRGFSGTSSATPALIGSVAALVSILKQQGESIDARLLKLAVQASASAVPETDRLRQGAGLLQVDRAYDIYRRLAAEQRAAQADASHRTAFPYDLRATIRLPGQADDVEGLNLVGRPNPVTVNVTLSPASRALLDPLASVTPLQVWHEKDFLQTPEALAIQANGAAFTVAFRAEALQQPGVYSDVIELRRADGVTLLRIPVLIRIPAVAGANTELARVNTVLGPYGLWRTSFTLDQATALRFTGLVQDLDGQLNARLGFTINTPDGHKVFEELKTWDTSTQELALSTPVLKAGSYELVVFRHYGQPAVVGSVQVTGSLTLPALSVKAQTSTAERLSVVVANRGAAVPAAKAVLTLTGKEQVVTLQKDLTRQRPGYYGAFTWEDLAAPALALGMRQNSVDRMLESFLHMSVAIQGASEGNTLYRGWLDVEDAGSPLRGVALSAQDAQGSYAVVAYPNIANWQTITSESLEFLVKGDLRAPIAANASAQALARGGVLRLDFSLPAAVLEKAHRWFGTVNLLDRDDKLLATVPVIVTPGR